MGSIDSFDTSDKGKGPESDPLPLAVVSVPPDTGRRRKSPAWSHFEATTNTTARCKKCNDVITHCGNTTNLSRHLSKAHDGWNGGGTAQLDEYIALRPLSQEQQGELHK